MTDAYKKLPLKIVLVAALISLALSGLSPYLFARGSAAQPPLTLLLGTGLAIILVTAGILALALKLGLPLRRSTMGLVLLFNACIVVVKFVIAPLALYTTNQTQSFLDTSFIVSSGGYWIVAAATFLLYALALLLVYRLAARVFSVSKPKKHRMWLYVLGVAVAGVLIASFGGAIGFLLVILPISLPLAAVFDYLSKTGPGLVLILALLVSALVVAALAFRQAVGEARLLRNASVIASLFWLCLSLLLMYHVLWVVFMGALITIWPFKTFSPNGK